MLKFISLAIMATALLAGCTLRSGTSINGPIDREKFFTLEVRSKPSSGMEVIIDGVMRGRTPLEVGVEPDMTLMVEVSGARKWGYREVSTGSPGENGKVVIKADKLFYRVSYIRGGTFVMGRNNGSPDERPEHKVSLDGFFMGEHEVTNDEFSKFVRDSGYRTDARRLGNCWVFQNGLTRKPGAGWKNVPYTGDTGDTPVTCVSWNDADEYARWLSEVSGREFRLPTEAEWEYAATYRSGAVSGEGIVNLEKVAPSVQLASLNYCDESCEASWGSPGNDGFASLAPVKSYEPSEAGLFDMAGNVWEWCQDWYAYAYYVRSPGKNPQGPESKIFKVVRGGSWLYPLEESESRNRSYFKTSFRSSDVGFRLLFTP